MRKYLKLAELRALLKTARNPRDQLILRLMYETGMRVGELVALEVGDVDFSLGEISIRSAKWHKEGRKVPITNRWTLSMLSEYIGGRVDRKNEPVFISIQHHGFTREGIGRMIRACGKRAGLNADLCHPHALRHTHAVYALKSGINLRTLQENLGHSSIETTAIYLTMDIKDRREVYSAHPLPCTEDDDIRKFWAGER